LNPYFLRHSCATHFLEGGGAITDLQSILGHSEITTTQVYAASVDERRRDSVLRLNFLRTAVGGLPTRGKGSSA
jgi:integrase/recombinase XerD